MLDSLIDYNATDLLALLKKRDISGVELLERCIKQYYDVNPYLNAVVETNFEESRKLFKKFDDEFSSDDHPEPFLPLPVGVKDLNDVKGLKTTFGSPFFRDNVAKNDDDVVAQIKKSSAVIFGKTNVPYHSADIQSYNEIYGVSNNPWDFERTPGGSSGGSAASLAAGMSPLELGSDIGGSIRTPAHFCGVYGHKPTYNIVSEVGHLPPPPGFILTGNGLSVAGPLARSPEDLEIAMKVLAAPQSQDSIAWSIKLPKPKINDVKKLKVAVWPEEESAEIDEQIRSLIDETAEDLRSAGAQVEEVSPPFTFNQVDDIYSKLVHPIMSAGADKETLASIDALALDLKDDDFSELAKIARGTSLRARDYVVNNARRHFIKQKWQKFFDEYHVMLSPVCAVPAIKHNHAPLIDRTITVNGKEKQYWHTTIWAGPVVMANLPSTSVPIGLTKEGLPVNLQVIGPHLHDLTCIEVSKMIRDIRGGFRIPPGFE